MRTHQALRRAVIRAIGDALVERDVSERALSLKLGKHKNYINEIIHGQHVVKFEEFIAIAQALDMSPHDLLSRVLRP